MQLQATNSIRFFQCETATSACLFILQLPHTHILRFIKLLPGSGVLLLTSVLFFSSCVCAAEQSRYLPCLKTIPEDTLKSWSSDPVSFFPDYYPHLYPPALVAYLIRANQISFELETIQPLPEDTCPYIKEEFYLLKTSFDISHDGQVTSMGCYYQNHSGLTSVVRIKLPANARYVINYYPAIPPEANGAERLFPVAVIDELPSEAVIDELPSEAETPLASLTVASSYFIHKAHSYNHLFRVRLEGTAEHPYHKILSRHDAAFISHQTLQRITFISYRLPPEDKQPQATFDLLELCKVSVADLFDNDRHSGMVIYLESGDVSGFSGNNMVCEFSKTGVVRLRLTSLYSQCRNLTVTKYAYFPAYIEFHLSDRRWQCTAFPEHFKQCRAYQNH